MDYKIIIVPIIIIFLVLLILIIILLKNNNKSQKYNNDLLNIYIDDINYHMNFMKGNKIFENLKNNNMLKIPNNKKNKFLFVSFDNRTNLSYLDKHNENINKYVNKYGYTYKFINTCYYNVYWCKIKLILDELENNNIYDYVIWLDSDTAIQNMDVDINDIVNKYNSDIFVGNDNQKKRDLINAGVFIIKNSIIGKQYLKDCINNVKNVCFNKDGSLNGLWASSCYEQGQMNILINNKYYNNTTILPNHIIFNYDKCSKDTFIMHFYRSGNQNMDYCFK